MTAFIDQDGKLYVKNYVKDFFLDEFTHIKYNKKVIFVNICREDELIFIDEDYSLVYCYIEDLYDPERDEDYQLFIEQSHEYFREQFKIITDRYKVIDFTLSNKNIYIVDDMGDIYFGPATLLSSENNQQWQRMGPETSINFKRIVGNDHGIVALSVDGDIWCDQDYFLTHNYSLPDGYDYDESYLYQLSMGLNIQKCYMNMNGEFLVAIDFDGNVYANNAAINNVKLDRIYRLDLQGKKIKDAIINNEKFLMLVDINDDLLLPYHESFILANVKVREIYYDDRNYTYVDKGAGMYESEGGQIIVLTDDGLLMAKKIPDEIPDGIPDEILYEDFEQIVPETVHVENISGVNDINNRMRFRKTKSARK